jgi:lysozyme
MDTKLEEQFEGCKLEAYPDPGSGGEPWTIGYGHTGGIVAGQKCTLEQAKSWLIEDVRESMAVVEGLVKVPMTDEQEMALVDFAFNVGAGNLAHSTLLRLLSKGDFAGAEKEFGKWDHASGRVLAGLTRRRAAEAALFHQGVQHGI